MADLKFSQFTSQPTTSTTEIVGYDGATNTRYTLAELYEQGYNLSSSQWFFDLSDPTTNSGTTTGLTFAAGSASRQYYNMLIDFPEGNTDDPVGQRDPKGTSSYNTIPYAYGIDIIPAVTGTPGVGDVFRIRIFNESLGTPGFVDYDTDWQGNLNDTVDKWVMDHKTVLAGTPNVRVSQFGGNEDASPLFGSNATIRLCSNQNQLGQKFTSSPDNRPIIELIDNSGSGADLLNSEVKNQFAEIAPYTGTPPGPGAGTRTAGSPVTGAYGYNNAWPDHFILPYIGQPYEGKYIHHIFRINFNGDFSSVTKQPTINLALRRFQNDSLIGSTIPITRNDAESGQLKVITSYTASVDDPFVTGGWYFTLEGQVTSAAPDFVIQNKLGFLIQNKFQSPTIFP